MVILQDPSIKGKRIYSLCKQSLVQLLPQAVCQVPFNSNEASAKTPQRPPVCQMVNQNGLPCLWYKPKKKVHWKLKRLCWNTILHQRLHPWPKRSRRMQCSCWRKHGLTIYYQHFLQTVCPLTNLLHVYQEDHSLCQVEVKSQKLLMKPVKRRSRSLRSCFSSLLQYH